MVTLASGTKVALAYARCTNDEPGTMPTTWGTAIGDMQANAATDFTSENPPYYLSSFESSVTADFSATHEWQWGMFFRSSGFTATNNNSYWRLMSITDGLLTPFLTNVRLMCHDIQNPSTNATTAEGTGATKYVELCMRALRATTRNVNLERNILESAEINPNRYKTDVRHGFNRVVGSVGFELSGTDFRDMIRSCVGASSWRYIVIDEDATPSVGYQIDEETPASGVATITKLEAVDTFEVDGVRAGDILRIDSATNPLNDGDWLVLSVSGDVITVYDPDDTMVDAANELTMTMTFPGRRCNQSTNLQAFILERQFTDIAQYQVFNGVVVDSMTLSVSPEAIVGGTFNMLGMSADSWSATSEVAAATTGVAPGPDYAPLAAFDGVVFEGGSVIAVVTAIELNIANGRSLNPVVGSKFSPTVFDGICVPTGTLSCYFEDATMVNKFVNETNSSIWFKLEDPADATRFIAVVLTDIKYTGSAIDPPAEGPVTLEMPFMALGVYGQNSPTAGGYHTTMTFQDSSLI